MTSSKDPNDSVRVSDVTPHNRALYETGKSLLIDSVKTRMDFCKFMIGVATGAIPTYLALLKLAIPGAFQISRATILIALVPPVLFLFAAAVFVIGFSLVPSGSPWTSSTKSTGSETRQLLDGGCFPSSVLSLFVSASSAA
jgi:hypothetical protein